METEILTAVISGMTGVIATFVGMIKYMARTSQAREEMIFEYFEKKNGHMERMAERFTSSSNNMTKAVNALRTEIRIMNERLKK